MDNKWIIGKRFISSLMLLSLLTGCSDTYSNENVSSNEQSSITEDIPESSEDVIESVENVESPGVTESEITIEEPVEDLVVETPISEPKLSSEEFLMNNKVVVPENEMYVVVNDNVPLFTNEDISSTEPWETYGDLDKLGRVTTANAVIGVELMPAEERGSISEVTPTGWVQEKYDSVSGGWLYNRSHMIGFQLTGENANKQNLMTGTRAFNVDGMLEFENFVANYIEQTENHVRYRVTPHFEGDNKLASGVLMEGFSIEDNGEGVQFNVYVANKQPGISIDYTNGNNTVNGQTKPHSEIVPTQPTESDSVTYKNCSAVREAGKSPIKFGDVGYGKHLDRDGDGVGCE